MIGLKNNSLHYQDLGMPILKRLFWAVGSKAHIFSLTDMPSGWWNNELFPLTSPLHTTLGLPAAFFRVINNVAALSVMCKTRSVRSVSGSCWRGGWLRGGGKHGVKVSIHGRSAMTVAHVILSQFKIHMSLHFDMIATKHHLLSIPLCCLGKVSCFCFFTDSKANCYYCI